MVNRVETDHCLGPPLPLRRQRTHASPRVKEKP